MKFAVLVSLFLLLTASLQGQANQSILDGSNCHTEFVPMPEEDVATYVQAMHHPQRALPDSIYIPIVVHNLTWNNNGYLQDSVLYDVIQKTNAYLANRGIGYDHRGFDTRIRLRLVTQDPNGQPHNGIIHQENIIASHEDLFEDHFDTALL